MAGSVLDRLEPGVDIAPGSRVSRQENVRLSNWTLACECLQLERSQELEKKAA